MNTLQAMLSLLLAGSGGNGASTDATPKLISIPEIENTPEAIILRVSSNGCTKRSHFRLRVDKNESLRVIRLRKDLCRMEPEMVEFRYRHEDLGVAKPLPGNKIAGK